MLYRVIDGITAAAAIMLGMLLIMQACNLQDAGDAFARQYEAKRMADMPPDFDTAGVAVGIVVDDCDTVNYPCDFFTLAPPVRSFTDVAEMWAQLDTFTVLSVTAGAGVRSPEEAQDSVIKASEGITPLNAANAVWQIGDTFRVKTALIYNSPISKPVYVWVRLNDGHLKRLEAYKYPCALYGTNQTIDSVLVREFIGVDRIGLWAQDSAQAAGALQVLIDSCATGVVIIKQGTPIDTLQEAQLDSLFNTIIE